MVCRPTTVSKLPVYSTVVQHRPKRSLLHRNNIRDLHAWEISCFQSVRFFSFNFDLIAVIVMSFWVSYCGNMTSYRFFKMAAAVAQYYFQFNICWCPCLQKVKIYQETTFCRHKWSTYISLWLRYNDFLFGKRNVYHIGILLPVPISTIFP